MFGVRRGSRWYVHMNERMTIRLARVTDGVRASVLRIESTSASVRKTIPHPTILLMDAPQAGRADNDWPDIARQHGQLVWQTAYRLLGNHADAEDCFQETFVSLLQMPQNRPVANWPGLVQKVATARALDRLRRRGWERAHQSAIDEPLPMPSPLTSPAQHAQDAELAKTLRWALSQVPPQQAQAYCLRHLNELSYGAIAQELGVSTDHVGVLLHRCRARLRELLADALSNETQQR
jgi:RNA polymerase sigma-70 factor, ECF subfamily